MAKAEKKSDLTESKDKVTTLLDVRFEGDGEIKLTDPAKRNYGSPLPRMPHDADIAGKAATAESQK